MIHRVACIQMTSTADVTENLSEAKNLIQRASEEGAKLVVLPENFAIMGVDPKDKVKYKEEFGHGPIQDFLKNEAVHYGIWIVGGTIPLASPVNQDKVYASCLVYDNQGQCAGRYDKIHLFDVKIRAAEESHNESNTILPGKDVVVIDTPFGKLGLAVCYDLRFPELFRLMQTMGAEIIALPAAFTQVTGMAHWDILIRARAIENQIYMVAAAQTGEHANHRKTYGHSMIVNPWGEVKASLPVAVGTLAADIDLAFLHQLRGDFPVLQHRKH